MKWFKDEEMRCWCCGELPPFVRANIEALVREVLDPAREKLGKAVTVTSGYRCQKHNRAVGGSVNSQHLYGEAADITAGSPEDNMRLVRLIVKNGRWDQMILYRSFIHVSWKKAGGNRKEILRKMANGYVRVREGDSI